MNRTFLMFMMSLITAINVPSLKTAVIMLEIVNELFGDVDIPDELYSLVSHKEHLYLPGLG